MICGQGKGHSTHVSVPKQRGRTKTDKQTTHAHSFAHPHPRAVHLIAMQRQLEAADAVDALEEVQHASHLHLNLVLSREDVRIILLEATRGSDQSVNRCSRCGEERRSRARRMGRSRFEPNDESNDCREHEQATENQQR